MIDNYLIQVTQPTPSQYLAEVKEQIDFDQRDGAAYKTIGAAMEDSKGAAIKAAIGKAFGA